ncbi:MAG: DUF1415 family protein [Polyangiaceae bacterium]
MFRADLSPDDLAALEQEALRINLRFVTEIIESKHVCPFARAARLDGSSVRRVCLIDEPRIDAIIEVIAQLEKVREPEVAVGQIIMPRINLEARPFAEFVAEVGKANAARFPGSRPVFVHAAFHPDLAYSTDTPSRMVPYFRRSPDPLMQVVRLEVLDSVHANRPSGSQFWDGSPESLARLMAPRPESVTDRISRDNHTAAMSGGLEELERIHADIAADRARSYSRFFAAT